MSATALLGFGPPLVSRGARSAGLRGCQPLRKIGLRRNAAAAPLPVSPLPPQPQRDVAADGNEQEHSAVRHPLRRVNWPRKLFWSAVYLGVALSCFLGLRDPISTGMGVALALLCLLVF